MGARVKRQSLRSVARLSEMMGKPAADISEILKIKLRTVIWHIENAKLKLGAQSISQATASFAFVAEPDYNLVGAHNKKLFGTDRRVAFLVTARTERCFPLTSSS